MSNSNSEQDKIYSQTAQVYTSLQNYNSAYTSYLTCVEKQPIIDPNTGHVLRDSSSNKFIYSSANCNKPDSVQLLQQIDELQTSISTMVGQDTSTNANVLRTSALGSTPANTDSSMNHTAQNYNQLLSLRNELDTKLQELYETNGSIPIIYQQDADSAVYATILWTILASSLLYYFFTKRDL
jgi:hypothetical protein